MVRTDFSKRQISKYIGDTSQILGVKDYTLNGGKAQGVRAFDVKNGSGLEFTVLPDRCLDLAWLSYKGVNLSYIGKPGIVAPQYYNETGINFLRSFFAGFLTTCGLRNIGAPNEEDGETLGLHGRISNTPGEDVSARVEWVNEKPLIKIKGKMREARLFGENLVLTREISCWCGENRIRIEDNVENEGFRKESLMLLYHFNLGYPLLDENAYLLIQPKETKPCNEEASKDISNFSVFSKPTSDFLEQVFYHDLKSDGGGNTCAALVNEKLELGVVIRFNKKQLFNLTQWKMMGEGDYVLGIEPCNSYGGGRADSKSKGFLEYLEPGEVRRFQVEAEIIEGMTDINRLKHEVSSLV